VILRLIAALGVLLLPGAASPAGARHDVHVTLTRMAVDSAAIVARVRCFKDDLQLGLAKFYKLQKLDLGAGVNADSLFGGYLAERMWVEVDGARLRGMVQASGVEVDDQGQPMMWFVVEYPTTARPKSLGIRNDLLFEIKSSLILQPGPAALTDGVAEIEKAIGEWVRRSRDVP